LNFLKIYIVSKNLIKFTFLKTIIVHNKIK